MKKEFKVFSLVFLFAFVFSLSLVTSATEINITAPVNATSVSGSSYNLTSNFTEPALESLIGNVTFYYQPYAGATINSTWTLITTVENVTENQTQFYYSWDTTTIIDNDNITINATAKNYDGSVNSTQIRQITIDNGNPSPTLSSDSFASVTDGYNAKKTQTLTLGTSTQAKGILSCLIYCTDLQNSTVYSTTATASANTCSNSTMTVSNFPLFEGKSYNCLVQETDRNSDSGNSSTRRLNYVKVTTGGLGSGSGDAPASGVSQSILGGKGISNFGSNFVNTLKVIWDKIIFWN